MKKVVMSGFLFCMGIGGSQTGAAQGDFTEEEQKKVEALQQRYSEII
ncbi:hypothetical protein [uncultured Enterococcus sp.]|nr:hypothetical protein [uncultured Enterococcus sp.]